MNLLSITEPIYEGSREPLESAGEIRGRKSRRHRVPLLTLTGDDDERFLHWLVSDHKLLESSGSALNASPKDSEWLLQSKEIETWKTNPHSVLWLYGTGK